MRGGGSNIIREEQKSRNLKNIFAKVAYAFNNLSYKFHISTNYLFGISFPYISYSNGRNYQILVYHRVNDESDLFSLAIPKSVFEDQMNFLSQNYNVMSLEEILLTDSNTRLPKNTIAITFDDGYMDNYTHAFPILKKLKLPATIFLSTGYIGHDDGIWHDRVFNVFRQTKVSSFVFEGLKYSMTNLEEKLMAQESILNYLKYLTPQKRLDYIQRLEEQLCVVKNVSLKNKMLTWDVIKEMNNHGISFGAHTVTHTILTALPLNDIKREVSQSKEAIEDILRIPVRLFAYPNGKREDYNNKIKEIIKNEGFKGAVTTIFGTNRDSQDAFELKRVIPWDFNLHSFALRLSWYKLVI